MPFVLKFLKFALVGCSGLIVDFGLTWLCKEKLRLNRYMANGVGFIGAVCNNYYLNRVWTFESHNRQWHAEFERFILISIIGLVLNSAILYALHRGVITLPFYISKALATCCVLVWNFAANFLFTFV